MQKEDHDRANMKKHCPACDQDKDLPAFSFDTSKADGRNVYCRRCRSARRPKSTAVRPRGRPRRAVKVCTSCPETRVSEFGVDRHRLDGLNGYCRSCVRRGRSEREATRKPCVISPAEKVRSVIRRPRTREEIALITGYDEQIVSDVLAKMWDEGNLDRTSLRRREYRIAA